MRNDGNSAPAGGGDAAGLRSLERALDVLSLLGEDRPSLSTKEVVDATGLPKTTVVRLLHSLEMKGLLWVDERRRYVAGPNLLRWSLLAAGVWQVSAAVRLVLREAAESCGETAHVYTRRGTQRICIAQHESRQTLRHVVRVGDELPLWTGGASNVLLIGASPERIRRVAARSAQGVAMVETLVAAVKRTAEAGYGVSYDEPEVGLSTIAVPIRAATGHVLASLSIGGPSARMRQERVPGLAKELARLAERLDESDFASMPQSSFAGREGPGKSWADPVL